MPVLRWLMTQIPRESILACSFCDLELNNALSDPDGLLVKFIPLNAKNREFVLAECSPSIENLINSKLGGANRLANDAQTSNFHSLFTQKFTNWFYLPHVDHEVSLSEKYLDEIGISRDATICKVWFNDGDTILVKFMDEGMEYLFCHYYYCQPDPKKLFLGKAKNKVN